MLFVFFFNDTATTEIYTLSLHDALPIYARNWRNGHREGRRTRRRHPGGTGRAARAREVRADPAGAGLRGPLPPADRKSTRLNSSHANISYAVFCLKKKKNEQCIAVHPMY